MKTTKRFLLAAILIALAFTFSCSDEKDDKSSLFSYGCKTPGYTIKEKTGDLCEGGEGIPESEISPELKNKLKVQCEDGGKSTYYNSCPTDYVLKCNSKTNEYKIYCLYGDEFKNVTCEEFFEQW